MSTELVVLEVSEKNYPKIYCVGGLGAFYQKAKAEVEGEVPDISTRKGRDRIATLAADVSRSKTAVEKPGRAYNKFLKAQPKLIDKELREYCDKMDQLRDDTRAPLTAWEEIDKAEKKQIADTEAYLIKFAADVEEGYRDNELFDLKAKQAEIERQAEIEDAAEDARIQAEVNAAAEINRAEREKQQAIDREIKAKVNEARAKQDVIDAKELARYEAEQAEQRRIIAKQQAERDAGIAADNARQAELKRQSDEAYRLQLEQEARETDLDNRAAKNNAAKEAIIALGFQELGAKAIIKAIVKGNIPHITINY